MLMNKDFFDKCADLMGTTHEFNTPVPWRNRWNTRRIGNGRFPRRGVIRPYGPTCIHVMLTNPRFNKTFTSVEALFEALERIGIDYPITS